MCRVAVAAAAGVVVVEGLVRHVVVVVVGTLVAAAAAGTVWKYDAWGEDGSKRLMVVGQGLRVRGRGGYLM